jgi:hypothetical protein
MKWIAVSLLLTAPMTTVAQTCGATRLKQFADAKTGVSFRYPHSWELGVAAKGSVEADFTDLKVMPIVAVSMENGKSSPYRNSTLVGAEFLYATRPMDSSEGCSKLIFGEGADAKREPPRTIHGMTFAHVKTTDAWTCHYLSEDLFATYQNGTCHLFDLAIESECFGAVDGERLLTKDEMAQIEETLNDILSTVSIDNEAKN